MEWNQDEEMLLMLYGEDSLTDTIAAMKSVRGKLQPDETELDRMLASVIWKLQRLSDILCFEHCYSIIQRKTYAERNKRTVYPKRHTIRSELE
jgi:hypothetical protein